MQDKKKRNDLILVGVIVGVLLAFGAGLLLFHTEGDRVVVSVASGAVVCSPAVVLSSVPCLSQETIAKVENIIRMPRRTQINFFMSILLKLIFYYA